MKLIYLSTITVLLFFASCDPGTKDCPMLPEEKLQWLVYNLHDTISFKNDLNDTIRFIVQEKHIPASYTEKCSPRELFGTYCSPCESSAEISALSNTQRNGRHWLKISIDDIPSSGPGIYRASEFEYLIFDQESGFNINGQTTKPVPHNYPGEVVDSIALGGHVYYDVFVLSEDTVAHPLFVIWKSYYNKQYGVLGFEDRQTHTLFYRQ